MALSSTNFPTGVLASVIAEADAPCVGKFYAVEQIDLQSSTTNGLRDVTIEVNCGFAQSGTPGKGAIVGVGFQAFLTNTNGTYTGVLTGDSQSQYQYLFTCTINKISNTSITIDITIFVALDTDGLLTPSSGYNPARHLRYSRIDDPTPLHNVLPSVFLEQRELIIDVNTSIGEFFTFRKPFRARFWNQDLDGSISSTVVAPLFEIPATIPVTGDIPIKVSFTTALTLGTDYIAGIFQGSSQAVGNNVVSVNQLIMRDSAAGQVDSRIPHLEVTSMGAITALGGNLYSIEIEIDRDFPVNGVDYYVFFLVKNNANNAWHAMISYSAEIDTIYPASSGDVEVRFVTYDTAGKIWGTDCIANIAAGERFNVSVTMDKATYDANIITNGVAGTFNSNFRGGLLAITQTLPITTAGLVSISTSLSTSSVIDNGPSVTLIGSGRIPSSWAGQTGFAILTFVFEITLTGVGSYTDYISIPIRLVVNYYDDHPSGFHRLELISVKNENGDDVNPAMCLDQNMRLFLTYELTGVIDPADYVFIPFLRFENSETVFEFNTWNNPYLRRLESDVFIAADQYFTAGQAVLEIDPQLLAVNQRYCVGAIAKNDDTGLPASTCPTFDLNLVHSADQVNNFGFVYGVGVTLSNFSIPVTIEALDVTIAYESGGLNVLDYFSYKGFTAVTFTNQYGQIPIPNTLTFRYFIRVLTVDSSKNYCEYEIETSLLMSLQFGVFFETQIDLIGLTPD